MDAHTALGILQLACWSSEKLLFCMINPARKQVRGTFREYIVFDNDQVGRFAFLEVPCDQKAFLFEQD